MRAALERFGRDRFIALAGLGVVAAIGWLVLGHMSAGMTGMPAAAVLMTRPPHASAAGYGTMVAMWAAMMAAMMAPATSPGLSAYLTLARRRQLEPNITLAATSFCIGYLAAWFCYAALGATAQWVLVTTGQLSPVGSIASTYLSATVLIAAGLYQLAPLKRTCVTRCRSPLLQLMGSWRDGPTGALKLGFGQGAWCVGCCWALMVLMFVVGVMNLAWMAIVSGFIIAEKLVPVRWHLDSAAGLMLLAWGSWLLAAAG